MANGFFAFGGRGGFAGDAGVTDRRFDFSNERVRTPWRDHCTVAGEESVAATFLDALNII